MLSMSSDLVVTGSSSLVGGAGDLAHPDSRLDVVCSSARRLDAVLASLGVVVEVLVCRLLGGQHLDVEGRHAEVLRPHARPPGLVILCATAAGASHQVSSIWVTV